MSDPNNTFIHTSCELWQCTPRLRWKNRYVTLRDGTGHVFEPTLEQAWIDPTTGALEWRVVPFATEGEL